jgi:hypothetical protein
MMAMARLFTSVAAAGILTITLCGIPPASAAQFGGVEFPQGISSFADVVQSFNPAIVAGEPTAPHLDANKALGAPDWNNQGLCQSAATCNTVSLGSGGSITLRFTDNFLTGGGNSAADLWIFEVGNDIESTFVDISKDGVQWNSVGNISVAGGTRGIDLDFYGWKPTDLFSFVRLTDDRNQGATTGGSVGADIDAVGAISSAPASVPEPTASSLLFAALILAWLFTGRSRNGPGVHGPRPATAWR